MYEIYLSDTRGFRIALLDRVQTITYVRAANRPTVWAVTIPDVYPTSYIQPDNIVEIWRDGKFESGGFLRKWTYAGPDDSATVTLTGPSFLYVLASRIIAYAAGESESAKSDFADDMIKAIVRENLGSLATDTDRDLSDLNFTVQNDASAGESLDRRFAWRKVLETCTALAKESTQRGTRIYFDVIPFWAGDVFNLEFRTYANQRGQDRTYVSNTPVVFGATWGNLDNPVLEYDYWDEGNYVYAGGQGLGTNRLIEEQSDTGRIAISPWNRREIFASVSNEQTVSEVQSAGEAALDARKPRLRFTADLLSVPGTLYGEDWDFGDKVVATHRDKEFDGHIDTVRVRVDRNGKESIGAKIEVLE